MVFSVIIPLYNKALYVKKAIDSALSQTFTDYELIIVDDGSTDNSLEIATAAIEGRGNCRLIRQKNAGVSVARDNGAAFSKGEYLCFLDADDWWEPTFLEEMDKLIEGYPDAGIYGTNYTIVNETKHKTRVAKIGVEAGFEKGYINYCQTYAKTMYMPLWTGAVCLPRTIFDEMCGFKHNLKLGEDFDLWIRIAFKYPVVFLNKPLSNYNQDVEAVSRGVGHLYAPQHHILWNLGYLESEEKTNIDYKELIDGLRVYDLKPYFISREYHAAALSELSKVKWNSQPSHDRHYYNCPIWLLKIHHKIMILGMSIKNKIRKAV